ncbi:MAG: hypothetical protein ABF633_03170 [Clostridium sp.]|uniref:hypothetical protein n=1 Tax=Clostridium sp. TaxID=1506 RepID=UPI0039EA18DF
MLKKITNLIEVRKLMALGITGLFILLAVLGKIDTKLVEYVVTSVIAFYFAKSTALEGAVIKSEKTSDN